MNVYILKKICVAEIKCEHIRTDFNYSLLSILFLLGGELRTERGEDLLGLELDWNVNPPTLRHRESPLLYYLHSGAFSALIEVNVLSCPFPRDRLRTMTNVLGDAIGAAVIEHLSQRELDLQEAELTLPSLGKPYKSLMAQEKGASRGRGGNESAM